MKLINKIIALSFLTSISISAFASDYTVQELRRMSQDQLDSIYLNVEAGAMPDGSSNGTAVFFPDSLINWPTQIIASLAWQGKVFNTNERILTNKVFGFRAINAEIYRGESLLDGRESIIIDYSETSLIASRIRDEIRQVGPGIYLGRAYLRTWVGDFMIINFILNFNK